MTHVNWHPYPEETPKRKGMYYVTFDDQRVIVAIYDPVPFDHDWITFGNVVAFADIIYPEPYRVENENERYG